MSGLDVGEGQGVPEAAGRPGCVGAASHWSGLGLKRLKGKHQGPEWLGWSIRQLGASSSRTTASWCGSQGSRHRRLPM